ncbi:MAG: hypothetical protein KF883_14950 [Thermomicrobiales bacterium]|nr:hypothetical protein [Thermomicrobiales bacterium]
MPLGGFGLISLFYAALGVRFAVQFWPKRKEVFDNNLTHQDRALLTQAAFFFLLPVSVMLHELGHAIAIWSFGGEVVDFGFYFFAGFVSYDPRGFSDVQQMLVAFAGTFVNILLIVIAMAIVMLKTPPLKPAWNELLLQFSAISGLNALVFYPLLDLATGMSGDWSQMYDGGVPWLTGIIVAVQFGGIALSYWLLRNPRTRARLAARTAVRNPEDRGLFSWGAGSSRAGQTAAAQMTPVEQRMNNAAARVSSGWPEPVAGRFSRTPSGVSLILQWGASAERRTAVIQTTDANGLTLAGGPAPRGGAATLPLTFRQSWTGIPSEDELTLALRVTMEQIEREARLVHS